MSTQFQYFAARSSHALAILDQANILTYANETFMNMVLFAGVSYIGCSATELSSSASFNQAVVEGLSQARNSGVEYQFAWENSTKLEDQSWNCRIIPTEGEILFEIAEQADTAGLKKALQVERVLRQQADLLRDQGRKLFFDVINELPIFVYMQRKDYTVAYANKKTIKFYGKTEGRHCYEVFGKRTSPCPHCPTFRVFDTGETIDWQFTDNDGRTFHIYDYLFEDEDGEPLVMEIGVDITELKRMEQELFQAQKMRAIGVLAGGIAHDLNNNLVPIIFNIDYALEKSTNAETNAPLSEALRAAYKASELVEQVLEYSRQQDVTRSPLYLTPLAKESIGLLQASLPSHITLKVDYSATQDCVLANPVQIQQILLNLCRNAVQAMGDGGTLSVSISNLHLDSQRNSPHPELGLGDHVTMTIQDTGCGIDPDTIERIFEPFYTSKQKSGGTGMGLAVVHAIASCNGGSIHVDSVPNLGTTFTVYLPCCIPEIKSPSKKPRPLAQATGRLLLVDDDMGALQAMKRVLRNAGYEVFTASNGQEGLKEYFRAKGRYDLVLTDQSMPYMTGMEMAANILKYNEDTKVIICTGHVESHLEAQADAAGVAGFIMKPMSPRILVESIRKHCI